MELFKSIIASIRNLFNGNDIPTEEETEEIAKQEFGRMKRYNQAVKFIEKYWPEHLEGFKKGYNTVNEHANKLVEARTKLTWEKELGITLNYDEYSMLQDLNIKFLEDKGMDKEEILIHHGYKKDEAKKFISIVESLS